MPKNIADHLATAGQPVDEQDPINIFLGGLQTSYMPFITSSNFSSRDNDFTLEDFQVELLGYENLLDINLSAPNSDSGHFAFAANKLKMPAYIKKLKPPLSPAKMQQAGSSNPRSQQHARPIT